MFLTTVLNSVGHHAFSNRHPLVHCSHAGSGLHQFQVTRLYHLEIAGGPGLCSHHPTDRLVLQTASSLATVKTTVFERLCL